MKCFPVVSKTEFLYSISRRSRSLTAERQKNKEIPGKSLWLVDQLPPENTLSKS